MVMSYEGVLQGPQEGGKLGVREGSVQTSGNGAERLHQGLYYSDGDETQQLDLEEQRENEELQLVCLLPGLCPEDSKGIPAGVQGWDKTMRWEKEYWWGTCMGSTGDG